jgi:hypothetical protein
MVRKEAVHLTMPNMQGYTLKPLTELCNLDDLPTEVDLHTWGHIPESYTDLVKGKTVIEVGAYLGASTLFLAQRAAKVYSVDTWLGSLEFYTLAHVNATPRFKNGYPTLYNQFAANMLLSGVGDKVYPIPLPSNLGAKLLHHYKIRADVVFIDASHEYEDVLEDLLAYSQLAPVIIGDDYTTWEGVKRAVDDFSKVHKYTKVITGQYYCLYR